MVIPVVGTIRRALALMEARFRRQTLLLAICSVAVAAMDLVGIVLLVPLLAFLGQGQVTEGAVPDFVRSHFGVSRPEHVALVIAGAAALLFVVKSVSSTVLLWAQAGVNSRAVTHLGERLLGAYGSAPYLVQQAYSTGTLVRAAAPGGALYAGMTYVAGAIVPLAGDVAVFVAVMVALGIVDPLLAVGAVAYLVGVSVIFSMGVRRPVSARGAQVQSDSETMGVALVELVGGIKELVIRDSASRYVARYIQSYVRWVRAGRLLLVVNSGTRYLLETLMIIGVAAVMFVVLVGFPSSTALVSIGVLLAGGFRALPALSNLMTITNQVRYNKPALDVIETELEMLSAERQSFGATGNRAVRVAFNPGSEVLAFNDVSFRYPSATSDALRDITLAVGFGESIGVVGGTGAGKSTFLDIALGLLEPTQGLVTVAGQPIGEVGHAWRNSIGYVPQSIFLADDTILANIVFSPEGDEADLARVEEVARLAHLQDVIGDSPEGLATRVGERGARLSGGQRQRLGLARALYRRPSVLILDEATSALDNATEASITETIRRLHGEITMLVVAHRLSTVRSCDRIVFLDEGAISGVGAFDDLVQTCPGFRRLVDLGSV